MRAPKKRGGGVSRERRMSGAEAQAPAASPLSLSSCSSAATHPDTHTGQQRTTIFLPRVLKRSIHFHSSSCSSIGRAGHAARAFSKNKPLLSFSPLHCLVSRAADSLARRLVAREHCIAGGRSPSIARHAAQRAPEQRRGSSSNSWSSRNSSSGGTPDDTVARARRRGAGVDRPHAGRQGPGSGRCPVRNRRDMV